MIFGSLFSLKQFEIGSLKAKLENMNQPKQMSIYIFMKLNMERNLYFQFWNGTIALPVLHDKCSSSFHIPWTKHSSSFQDWKHGRRKGTFSQHLLSKPTSNLVCLLLSVYIWNSLSSSSTCSYRSNLFSTHFYPLREEKKLLFLVLLQPADTNKFIFHCYYL